MLLRANASFFWLAVYGAEKKFLKIDTRNSSSVADGYFTEVELESLEKKVAEIKSWKENAEKEQKAQPMSEMPKLTTRYN